MKAGTASDAARLRSGREPLHGRYEMFRLLQTMALAGIAVAVVACSESRPTAPEIAPAAAATGNLVGLSAPAPTVSCMVTTDGSTYAATVTWSDLTVTSFEFLNGSSVLTQSELSHPLRNGSVTVTLTVAPTLVELIGVQLGARTLCHLVS
jgi:hypothetical protein